jgi:hypothetical protein
VASDRIRPAMTTWPILQDSRKGTKSGCTVWPGPEECHPSSSHPGKAIYQVITQINNVVCQIQWHPRAKMMVVHLDGLAPHLRATQDEQP